MQNIRTLLCVVKWPKANKEEWLQFDADTILEVTASTRHALHPPQEPQKVLSEESGVAHEKEKRLGQEVGWISTKSSQVHKVTAWKEVERDTCYDRSREQDLGHCQHLFDPPAPALDLNGKETSLKEIHQNYLAPGPCGVPYRFYKNCPKLLHRLWKLLKVTWSRRKVAQQNTVLLGRKGVVSKGGGFETHELVQNNLAQSTWIER